MNQGKDLPMFGPPTPPNSGSSRRHFLARLVPLPAVVATACTATAPASAAGLRWTTAGRARRLTGLTTVLVRDFKDRVSEKYDRSTLERHAAKRDQMRDVVSALPDRIADALRQTGAFGEVRRAGPADAATLQIDGAVFRYEDEDGSVRLQSGNVAGNAQLEVRLELRDGARGTVLATLIAENSPAGVSRVPQSAESLASARERVCGSIARTVAAAARS